MDMRTKTGSASKVVGGENILSPEQLAAYLGIKRTFAYQLLSQKRIPSFTIGKLRRVRKADVDRYVEERRRVTRKALGALCARGRRINRRMKHVIEDATP
jgi:excisionase family DNA binding protein